MLKASISAGSPLFCFVFFFSFNAFFSFLAQEVTDVITFPLSEISGSNRSDLSLSFASC